MARVDEANAAPQADVSARTASHRDGMAHADGAYLDGAYVDSRPLDANVAGAAMREGALAPARAEGRASGQGRSANDGGPMWRPLPPSAGEEQVPAWPAPDASAPGRSRSRRIGVARGAANAVAASRLSDSGEIRAAIVTSGVNGASLVHAGVASLLAAAFFGAWIAAERASASRALAWFVIAAALYLVTTRLAWNGDRWRRAAFVLVASGAALAAFIILQYRHLSYPDKLSIARAAGWITSAWLPALGAWTPFSNSVATFLEGLLPLAFGLTLGRRATRGERITAAACLTALAFALFLTVSRGAWVAVLVAFTFWLLVSRARGQRVRLAIAFAIAFGLIAASGWAAFTRPDRLDLYRHTLSLVRDFPFTGIGLGDQFAMVLSQHALLIQVPFLTYSHNLFLDLWLELGLPGALTWVALVTIILIAGIAGERAELGSGYRGAWLGLLAIVVHGLSDARQSVDAWTWLPFFALLGLLSARLRRVRVTIPRAGAALAAAAPAALLIAVTLATWPVQAAWHVDLGGLDEITSHAAGISQDLHAQAVTAARAEYLDALRADDRQPTAHRRLGILAIDDARYADALAHLDTAASADPDNWTTRKALGLACVWTGDIERATQLLASLDDPGMPGELNAWSSWRESRGELSLARRAAQVSARLRPDPAIAQRIASLERMR